VLVDRALRRVMFLSRSERFRRFLSSRVERTIHLVFDASFQPRVFDNRLTLPVCFTR
jgi:hypothetical protein